MASPIAIITIALLTSAFAAATLEVLDDRPLQLVVVAAPAQ
jgi:hypothetical protein